MNETKVGISTGLSIEPQVNVETPEQAVRNHVAGLRCSGCREELVKLAKAGQFNLDIDELTGKPVPPNVEGLSLSPSDLAHAANHRAFHAWEQKCQAVREANAEAKAKAKEARNKVYNNVRGRGPAFRGEKLKAVAEAEIKMGSVGKYQTLPLPKLDFTKDYVPSYTAPVRPVKAVKKYKARSAFSEKAKVEAQVRKAEIDKTLNDLLNAVAEGTL